MVMNICIYKYGTAQTLLFSGILIYKLVCCLLAPFVTDDMFLNIFICHQVKQLHLTIQRNISHSLFFQFSSHISPLSMILNYEYSISWNNPTWSLNLLFSLYHQVALCALGCMLRSSAGECILLVYQRHDATGQPFLREKPGTVERAFVQSPCCEEVEICELSFQNKYE